MGTVLWREMLEAARRPGSWWLRWAGPLALIVVFACGRALPMPRMVGGEGVALFGLMSKASILLAWLVLPWMTADTIAAERREGTLGLLWLTPLTPAGVLVAKTLAHGIRAAWMLASLVPVMVLPVLLGGVGWADVARWALAWMAMAALSLTAGLVASVIGTGWWTVRVGAVAGNVVALGLMLVAWEVASALPAWLGRGRAGMLAFAVGRLRGSLAAKAGFLGELGLGRLPMAVPATWDSAGRMAMVAGLMTGMTCLATWAVARAPSMSRAGGIPPGRRWSWAGPCRMEAGIAWALAVGGGLLLGLALLDWPSPGSLRDLFPRWAIVLQGGAAVLGAVAVRDMAGSAMAEMVAVTPLGLAGWARWVLGGLERRLAAGWGLALLAQGIAGVAALDARWPWWLPWRLLVEAATAAAGGWAMFWIAAAAGWGRRPWVGIVASLCWGWLGIPLAGLAARLALDAMPWAYPGGWNESWQSSRLAWQQPRIGTVLAVGVVQAVLTVAQGAWVRRLLRASTPPGARST